MRMLSVKKRRILVVVFKLDEHKIVSPCQGAHFLVIILARQPRCGPATPSRPCIFFQTAGSRRKSAGRTNSRRKVASAQTRAKDSFRACLETAACVKQYLASARNRRHCRTSVRSPPTTRNYLRKIGRAHV